MLVELTIGNKMDVNQEAYNHLKSKAKDLMSTMAMIFSFQSFCAMAYVLNDYRLELFSEILGKTYASSVVPVLITPEHISYLWLVMMSAFAALIVYLTLVHIFDVALDG